MNALSVSFATRGVKNFPFSSKRISKSMTAPRCYGSNGILWQSILMYDIKTKAGRRCNRPAFSIAALGEVRNSTEELGLSRNKTSTINRIRLRSHILRSMVDVLLFVGIFFLADILLDVVEAQLLLVGAKRLFLDLLALVGAILLLVQQILTVFVVARRRDVAAVERAFAELAGERDAPTLARILVGLTDQHAHLGAVHMGDRCGVAVAAGHQLGQALSQLRLQSADHIGVGVYYQHIAPFQPQVDFFAGDDRIDDGAARYVDQRREAGFAGLGDEQPQINELAGSLGRPARLA